MSALLVQTVCGAREEAADIARAAVEARLAACAHVDAVASVYRWRGTVEQADEWRVWLKTTPASWEALAALIRARHSYEEPALVALPIAQGAPSYLAWIEANAGG